MKKLLAVLLACAMVFGLAACGESGEQNNEAGNEDKTYRVGMICIGNREQAYDRNFMNAADKATENLKAKGYNVEWLYSTDHKVDDDKVTTDNLELADQGCMIVYNNSYGQEAYMLKAAEEVPEVSFVGLTSDRSWTDDMDNTSNAFAEIYKGRYIGGVVAGLKLNELIENKTITEDGAILGYVGAFPYAEVVSGFTAFYMGAKSVCPSVKMYVNFINSWGNLEEERAAANSLIENQHAVVISQHSDNISPAEAAAAHGVYHVGYNLNMIPYAQTASLCSPRIDWTKYFETTIEAKINGKNLPADYCGTLANGEVVIDEYNDAILPAGAKDVINDVIKKLSDDSISVYNIANFGKVRTYDSYADPQWADVTLDSNTEIGLDIDGDFAPDITYKPIDANGSFNESVKRSAPYFNYWVEGVEMVGY